MKPEELRISNLVINEFHNDLPEIIEVSLTELSIIDMYNDLGQAIPFGAIPITEEWLLNFGFEKKKHVYPDGSQSFDFWYETWYIRLDIDLIIVGRHHFQYYQFLKNVEYVHQLQNLYFALTGEELKIK